MSAEVTWDARGLVRKIRTIERSIEPSRLTPIAGRAVLNLVKAHLVERNQTPNKLGGRRTNFYHKAAQGTHETHDATTATVTVSATGFALHRYGGTVVPVNRRALTIPIAAEAHGRRVSDFPDAFVVRLRGKAFIAQVVSKGKREGLHLLFALVRSATIKADASVLPEDSVVDRTASTAVDSFIARQIALANGGGSSPQESPA